MSLFPQLWDGDNPSALHTSQGCGRSSKKEKGPSLPPRMVMDKPPPP